jgi:ribosomal protein L7/L12
MEYYIIPVLAGVLGIFVAIVRIRSRVRRSDLDRLERKLDSVIRHLGLEQELLPKASDRVKMHLSTGNKIEAIRAYREENPGVGLKEAKEAVEDLQRGRAR